MLQTHNRPAPALASLPSPPSLPLARVSRRHHAQRRRNANLLDRVQVQAAATNTAPRQAPPREQVFTSDPANNVSDYVYDKMGMSLHQRQDHPIAIIKQVCVLQTLI